MRWLFANLPPLLALVAYFAGALLIAHRVETTNEHRKELLDWLILFSLLAAAGLTLASVLSL